LVLSQDFLASSNQQIDGTTTNLDMVNRLTQQMGVVITYTINAKY